MSKLSINFYNNTNNINIFNFSNIFYIVSKCNMWTGVQNKIFIVDKNNDFLNFLEHLLNCYAFDVIGFNEFENAKEALLKEEYNVVIVGINNLNSEEQNFLQFIKNNGIDSPLLLILSSKNFDNLLKLFQFHPYDIIVKPIEEKVFIKKVSDAYEKYRKIRSSKYLINKQLREHKEKIRLSIETIFDAYEEIFYRLLVIAEYKDNLTANHLKRVGYYSSLLAMHLGFNERIQDIIFYASQLHDIGKIIIPDSILFKKGRLNSKERKIIEAHTVIGAKILENSTSPILKMAEDIALNHHERWDGTGYPRGLKGEDIPIVARIVIIADVYDSLRGGRPYKKSLTHKETCEIIRWGDERTKPQHFDPEVLKTFFKLEKSFEKIYIESFRNPNKFKPTKNLVLLMKELSIKSPFS